VQSETSYFPSLRGGAKIERRTTTIAAPVSAKAGTASLLLDALGRSRPGAQMLADAIIAMVSFLIAYLIRYDGSQLADWHILQFAFWAPVLVAAHLALSRGFGIHRRVWCFVCLSDATALACALLPVTAVLFGLRAFYPASAPHSSLLRLPVGIIVPEYLLCLCISLAARSVCRMIREEDLRSRRGAQPRRRVLLYGAGHAGALLAGELFKHSDLEVVGFVDDNAAKIGALISGVRVLGTGSALEGLVAKHRIDEVLISIAAADAGSLARILTLCRRLAVATRIIPPLDEIASGRVNISNVREVRIEELLGRSSVTVGEFHDSVRQAWKGRRILVTGAGGSIGGELTRQLLLLAPSRLYLLDKDENSIFELEQELKFRNPNAAIEAVIADIKVPERLAAVFAEARPEVVFHAAAHKHVPLMEKHPCEAVLNNVMGTKNVLEACRAFGTNKFLFISSDKAVNPTNVMGATKRVGERLVSIFSGGDGLHAAAVRFGNVMGSHGSVIPLFRKQIEKGGPVTVTHPEIERFFMTIPEAVQLILCAGTLAHNGEVFVLDMGNPRKVIDLARQMIELSGLQPEKDIPIAITGLRPGEKMFEELVTSGESLRETGYEKVFQIAPPPFEEAAFRRNLDALIATARRGDRGDLVAQLQSMGLGYQPVSAGVAQALAETSLVASAA
jgi:FlaA1/EpsC-like NDP-sugar epimerase